MARKQRQALRCSSRRTNGEPCKAYAICGGSVCRAHGGAAPQVRAAANRNLARREIESNLDIDRLGMGIDVTPEEALQELLQGSAGNVKALQTYVSGLEIGVSGFDADGGTIAGPNHLGDGRPNVLVEMYNDERDRLGKFAKLAADAGVNARIRLLQKAEIHLWVEEISGFVEDLGLDPQAPEVRTVMRSHVRRLVSLFLDDGTDEAAA